MSTPVTGGCACGAIRYSFTGDPIYMGNCHCRDCQRASGTGHATVVAVNAAAFSFTAGTPRFHQRTADSGSQLQRGFCSTSGSPLLVLNSAYPEAVILHAGNLDNPDWVRPVLNIFTASAQPWDSLDPALPKVPGMPGF